MKLRTIRKKENSLVTRELVYAFYLNKYYSLFMNKYDIIGVDYQQRDFILRKFWIDGRLACLKLKGTEGSTEHPQGLGVFCPYAPSRYNIYDFPIYVTLINIRGVSFIPAGLQKVDEDVVIGWCQRNKKSVYSLVDFYLQKITDVEMVIKMNLKSQKTPWIVGATPEDNKKIQSILDNLEDDNPNLFVDLENVDRAKALVSGAPYVLDKLYNYKQALENELKEYLGLENMGMGEKKEHLITAEIEASDEVIGESKYNFIDTIKEFFDNIEKVLGLKYDIVEKHQIEYSDDTEEEEEVEDDE